MNSQERTELLSRVVTLTMAITDLRARLLRSCEHCDNWEGMCTKWNAMPPPEVIESGCPDWVEQVPF